MVNQIIQVKSSIVIFSLTVERKILGGCQPSPSIFSSFAASMRSSSPGCYISLLLAPSAVLVRDTWMNFQRMFFVGNVVN